MSVGAAPVVLQKRNLKSSGTVLLFVEVRQESRLLARPDRWLTLFLLCFAVRC